MKKDYSSLFKVLFKNVKTLVYASLAVLSLVSIILTVLVALAGVYGYNFVPIRTINLCISNNTQDLPIEIECFSDDDCAKGIINAINNQDLRDAIEKETGDNRLTNISLDIMSNLVDTVSEEIIKCVDNKCKGAGIENFGQLFGSENKECIDNEKSKKIEIFMKDVVPPRKLLGILKTTITSKDFRSKIAEFIKTGELF